MLLNNYRTIIDFYCNGTFKNVEGDTVYKRDVFPTPDIGSGSADSAYRPSGDGYNLNTGNNSRFDYFLTANTNDFTDEQTAYHWCLITDNQGTGGYGNIDFDKLSNGFVIFVGSGNTAVTANDFKLASPLELGINGAACTHKAGRTVIQRTFVNNTNYPVTIREVGAYVFIPNRDTLTVDNFPLIMIGRKVLATPITLDVDDEITLNYQIDNTGITFAEAEEDEE